MLLGEAKESKSNDVPKTPDYCSNASAAIIADANYYPANGGYSKEPILYVAIVWQGGREKYDFKRRKSTVERARTTLSGVLLEFSASAVNRRKDRSAAGSAADNWLEDCRSDLNFCEAYSQTNFATHGSAVRFEVDELNR